MISICIPTIKSEAELLRQTDDIRNSFSPDYREGVSYEIVIQSAKQSAAKNRNAVLAKSKGDYVVMIDDDVVRFPRDWAVNLVNALGSPIKIISARLMTRDGTPGTMISFRGDIDTSQTLWLGNDYLLPSACIAFSRETWEAVRDCQKLPLNQPFDEGYKKAVCEDSDFCCAVRVVYPDMRIAVHNGVEVTHLNHEVWRTPDFRWEDNHEYFKKKWRRDPF